MSNPSSPPDTGLAAVVRDCAFIAAILAVAAVPLLGFYKRPIWFPTWLIVSVWVSGLGLLAAWTLSGCRAEAADAPAATPRDRRWWVRVAGLVAAVMAGTVVIYYLPMREHFWGGYDEHMCLLDHWQKVWYAVWDDKFGRPTWGIGPLLGGLLAPEGAEGHVWLAGGLWAVNALLLVWIVRRLLPGEPAVAAAAGVLLLCHRGDISRFYVMWAANWYLTSRALLLLGTWLLLESGRAGHRGGLAAACLVVGVSLLGSEAGFPLAALGPVLLWLSGVRGPRLYIWSAAWVGTVGLLAARFALYLLTSERSYQADSAAGLTNGSELFFRHILRLTEPFLTWFDGAAAVSVYPVPAALAAAAGAAAVLVAGRSSAGGARRFAAGAAVAAAAAVAGLVGFLPFPNAFRTQFYTAPGQAALLAVAAGGVCRLLGRRAGPAALAACAALMAAGAAAENRRFQQEADTDVNSVKADLGVNYVKTVRVLRQINAITATRHPHTLVVLCEAEGAGSIGANYQIQAFSDFLGYDLIHASRVDVIGLGATFEADAVVLSGHPDVMAGRKVTRYPYDQVVAYRLAADGTLTLHRELPGDLLPAGAAPRYDPLPLLQPGPVAPLRHFRYPRWVKQPRDVINPDDGLVLGPGWSDLTEADGRLVRRAAPGAELVVNPLDRTSRTITLEAEPEKMSPGATYMVEARDLGGRTLCAVPVRGRGAVTFTVPTEPERVSVVTFWAGPAGRPVSSGSAVGLRVFAPPGARALPATTRKRDIVGAGLRLGRGWYPVENYTGEPYRWMTSGAEVVVGDRGGAALAVDVGVGPGLGGRAGRLRAVGPDGAVLADEPLPGRSRVRVPVPPDLPRGAAVRLEVVGGGSPVGPADPRVLDALIWRVGWTDDPPAAPPGR